MLKIPTVRKRYSQAKLSCHFLASFFLIRYLVSAGYCQRDLVDESGMIRTQMRKHNRPLTVAVYGTPCAIPPRNSTVFCGRSFPYTSYKTHWTTYRSSERLHKFLFEKQDPVFINFTLKQICLHNASKLPEDGQKITAEILHILKQPIKY
jgi:hypothetical protein